MFSKDRFKIDVSEPQPDDTPSILYKYRSFDPMGYHLQLIRDAKLWFTSARNFNDPFDSSLQYQLSDTPRGIRHKWADTFLKRDNPDLDRMQRKSIVSQRLREIDKDQEHYEWFRCDYVERNYQKFGICCLTPTNDNLLMWSHYSDNHRGFCVGVNMVKLKELQYIFSEKRHILDLVKVTYTEIMPEINFFSSMISERWHQDIMTLLSTKSEHWSYEQEFRLIYWDHIDTAVNIGHNAIAEVVLGCRVNQEDKKNVLTLLEERHCRAEVFQTVKNKTMFALEFERIR